jgi:hypothetical protein
MGKMFQNASSLKPLGQLKPNCPGMIIGKSSTKFLFFMPIGNPRWLPPQVIVLTKQINNYKKAKLKTNKRYQNLNQRPPRACIVHLVIKRINWLYVKN